jgi:tRNA A58 N-methylase Trm61
MLGLAVSRRLIVPEPSKAQLDHAQEVALRTGYKDGVSAAISGMAHKLSKRDHGIVDRWFLDILTPWAIFMGPHASSPAPDFPRLPDDA